MEPLGFKYLGAGLIVIGAAIGIGRIGGQAMDAIARQPEASGKIQTAMLIAASQLLLRRGIWRQSATATEGFSLNARFAFESR